jgi:GntR family transcriptional regulator
MFSDISIWFIACYLISLYYSKKARQSLEGMKMDKILKFQSSVPLYSQIKSALLDAIQTREFKPNEKIPGETDLEEFFGVSRMTIRKAISELVEEGILVRKQGKGTFLSDITVATTLDEISGYTKAMTRLGYRPGRRLISRRFEEKGFDYIKDQLGIPKHAQLVHIKRVLLADDEPIALENTFYPDKCKFFMEVDLDKYSMYQLLKERMHIVPFKAQKTIGIELATQEDARYLNTTVGFPLLVTNELVVERDETPIHYSISHALSNRIKIRLVSYAPVSKSVIPYSIDSSAEIK